MQARVLDTNIVLDLWVFQDPGSESLSESLKQGAWVWLATEAMREELSRVLAYANIARRLEKNALSAESVLARFDAAV
ncbi:MAG: PIN domain-containing protein, partial [Burkholderiaceae bacterium]|nr:PIN domain-containing protein [Burkholderiaceae bacterium]